MKYLVIEYYNTYYENEEDQYKHKVIASFGLDKLNQAEEYIKEYKLGTLSEFIYLVKGKTKD